MSSDAIARGMLIPPELEPVREAALRAIGQIRPADEKTKADRGFLFKAKRTTAGKQLPAYYLVYFLLVDLLGFRDLGRCEKVAWSVPIEFNGQAFLIDYRKFGVGVFALESPSAELPAAEIVTLIKSGVKKAEPFFDWLAARAVQGSKLNVLNRSRSLFERYEFHLEEFKNISNEAKEKAHEVHEETRKLAGGGERTHYRMPAFELQTKARWLGLATIDAFFSWTEHIFIHIAILNGKAITGTEVTALADAEWSIKFKAALDLTDAKSKEFYDDLVVIRRQFRNFIAHGSFGRQGQAFKFHSGTGSVPVTLGNPTEAHRFAFGLGFEIAEAKAIEIIQAFIEYLWSGNLEPARMYIQESELPSILALAKDGTYQNAMTSVEGMASLVKLWTWKFDQAADMDW